MISTVYEQFHPSYDQQTATILSKDSKNKQIDLKRSIGGNSTQSSFLTSMNVAAIWISKTKIIIDIINILSTFNFHRFISVEIVSDTYCTVSRNDNRGDQRILNKRAQIQLSKYNQNLMLVKIYTLTEENNCKIIMCFGDNL